MYFKLCFYIANATNVFLSSILDILRERGIPHQISPSTYHPWCYSVVSPVLYEVPDSVNKKRIAESGFDPPTSGLWAQHASPAPLCYICYFIASFIFQYSLLIYEFN